MNPPSLCGSLGLGLLGALLAVPALAQEPTETKVAPGFDPARAYMPDEPDFTPFYVEEADVQPLREALEDGRVDEATAVFVAERGDERIALIMDQMAYHHIAQGEMAGEPWMVSF